MPTATADGFAAIALDRWPDLVGLATLLTGTAQPAGDAYATALRRRVELPGGGAADAYLRRVIVERSRRRTRGANAPLDLDVLPRRQREALVLRDFSGATEAQTAAAMRCSAAEVGPLVAKALASLGVSRDVMTARMQTYAAGLDVDRPDAAAAAVAARRQRRRGSARVWTAAVIVIALLVAGVVVPIQPRGHGELAEGATGPLPGLTPSASIVMPAGLRIDDLDSAGGEVWAFADGGGDQQHFVLLHGSVGRRLVPVPGSRAPGEGVFPDVVVSGGRALVLTGDEHTNASGNQLPEISLTTYDAATATEMTRTTFPVGDDAAFVPVLGGGPATEAFVTGRVASDGSGTLTVSLVEAGRLVWPRGPVPVASSATPYGSTAEVVSAVVVAGGQPSAAYLQGPPGSIERLDLVSDGLETVRLDGNMSQAGSSSGVLGEVGGRLLYESSDGLFAAAPGSSPAERVGDGDNQQEVLVVGGRAFTSVAPNDDTWQQLDPTTFAPVGPIVTTRAGQGPVLELRGSTAEVTVGTDSRGYGGTATFYGP